MLNTPLVSVIVATKNRSKYLCSLVDGFLLWAPSLPIELIIQDNSDHADTTFYDLEDSSQVKYFHTSLSLDMKENFLEGIAQASGDYLTLIGDDDFVLPEIINAAEYLKTSKIDALTCNRGVYLWPDVNSFWQRSNVSGYLYIPHNNKKPQIKFTSKGLNKILKNAGVHFDYELPSAYQGLISRKLLDTINKEHGSIFLPGSPDLSNAILVSFNTDKFILWDKSFIVSGASKGSGAAEGYSKKHHGSLSSRSYLNADSKDWPKQLPNFFSGSIIYTFTLYNALKASKNSVQLKSINYYYLYAQCVLQNSQYYRFFLPLILKFVSISNIFSFTYAIFDILTKQAIQFFKNFFIMLVAANQSTSLGFKCKRDIETSFQAQKTVLQNLENIY